MRSRLSTLMLTLVASALVASLASALPTIRFGQGPMQPPECIVDADPKELDCVATAGTQLTFSLIIEIGEEGTAGASFSAEWDSQNENALGSASANADFAATSITNPGPPPVVLNYTPAFGGPGVSQSTASSAGSAQSWSTFPGSPDSAVNILGAGLSYRAGRLIVTVDEEVETYIGLGFFQGGGADVFLGANGAQLTPNFGGASINAPEPTAALGLLAGLGSVALLARRSRRS